MEISRVIQIMPKVLDRDLPDWAQAEKEIVLYKAYQCINCGGVSADIPVYRCKYCGNPEYDEFYEVEVDEDMNVIEEETEL